MMTDEPPKPPLEWGYMVHDSQSQGLADPEVALLRFKLLLEASETPASLRDQLRGQITTLRDAKIIKEPLDVIADYLTLLLQHTQS
jgi:hypothetical protein